MIKQGDAAPVPVNYEIGEIVRGVKDNAAYGNGGVKKLARLLGKRQGWLYDAARVVEAWPGSEFEELMRRRDAVRGRPLCWTHWVMLAGYDDDHRPEMVEEVLEKAKK